MVDQIQDISDGYLRKGHMDKTKAGVGSRVGSGDGWGGGCDGGKMETTVLEQQ